MPAAFALVTNSWSASASVLPGGKCSTSVKYSESLSSGMVKESGSGMAGASVEGETGTDNGSIAGPDVRVEVDNNGLKKCNKKGDQKVVNQEDKGLETKESLAKSCEGDEDEQVPEM